MVTRTDDLTMVYVAGAISAMGRQPRDCNPFGPEELPTEYAEWDRGWKDHQGVTDKQVSDFWWSRTWMYEGRAFGQPRGTI